MASNMTEMLRVRRLNSSSRSALDAVCHLGQAIISSESVPSIKKIDYLLRFLTSLNFSSSIYICSYLILLKIISFSWKISEILTSIQMKITQNYVNPDKRFIDSS